MSDINFKQAVLIQNKEDEIKQVDEAFRRILSTSMANTLFQLKHYDLIEKGIELSEFVYNGDWSDTLLNKIKSYNKEVIDILKSEEFKQDEKVIKLMSKIMTEKTLKEKGE